GKNGFAMQDEGRGCLPVRAFAVWLLRQTPLPDGVDLASFIVDEMARALNLTIAERHLVFVEDPDRGITTGDRPLSYDQIHEICQSISTGEDPEPRVIHQSYDKYVAEVRSMTTPSLGRPEWLTTDPAVLLRQTLDSGAKAVLLFGPPRTGKTRLIDELIAG